MRSRLVTILIILATIILASVSVFTAFKLYQLRKQSVALNVPKSRPFAATCEEYDLLVDTNGTVRIRNNSTSTQPSREIDLIVNGQSIGSFTFPALDPDTDAILGGINLPEGDFNWSISGDIFCQGNISGTTHETTPCQTFNFTVSAQEALSPSPSTSPTPTLQSSPTPTSVPTSTPTASPSSTSTPTPGGLGGAEATSTPTATPTGISTFTPTSSPSTQLPDSGTSFPTLIGISSGILIVLGAIILAI